MKRDDYISGVIVSLFFLMAIIGIIAIDDWQSKQDQQLSRCSIQEYMVKEGDTLWGISEEYKPTGYQIQEYIFEIKKLNKINSEIYPGQKIKIYTEGGDPSGKTIFGDID